MAFQFLCPQGHLLQGEPSQVGQKCKCPQCQTEFLVPSPGPTPPHDTAAAQPDQSPVKQSPVEQPLPAEPPQGFPGIKVDDGGSTAGPGAVPKFGVSAAEQKGPLHIPCPQGHVLETPREMLGDYAMCPFCETQFRLRFEDSQEHQHEEAQRHARQQQKLGTAWMNWAIAAAVIVVFGLIVLIAIAASL